MKKTATPDRILLLSIKPKYADMIFSGIKKVELRRTKPKLANGDLVAIYVSSPVMALTGQFVVDEVVQEVPERLWQEVKNYAGITKLEFDEYFKGSKIAFGIKFERVKNFERPIPLFSLRKTWFGFNPPQIYRYLSQNQYNLVFSWKKIFHIGFYPLRSYLKSF
jgi:predicted transcriptional regulator